MKKELVGSLLDKVDSACVEFSKDRANNYSNVTYKPYKIVPQETTALVMLQQVETQQLFLLFFKYIDSKRDGGGWWTYHGISASDILGHLLVTDILLEVEKHNFPLKASSVMKEMVVKL
jgi:hypothetical protein